MDDLISRQTMREAMYHEAMEKDSDEQRWDGGCWIRYKMFERVIESIPSEPQWIPCSERLPEVNGRYFVTRGLNACGAMWNRVYIINYSDLMGLKSERIWWDGNVGKSDFQKINDVIAWMPLPEPYQESEG